MYVKRIIYSEIKRNAFQIDINIIAIEIVTYYNPFMKYI